jgi:putative protease
MKPYFTQIIGNMKNEEGEPIDVAPHAEQIVKFEMAEPVCKGAMLRKKR